MGNIKKITGKIDLPEPAGWNPEKGQFNLPFTIELKENFHIHWHDIRIEMMPEDFENFFHAINKAYHEWVKDGKPKGLQKIKRYGWWPGEEGFDFNLDRDRKHNKNNEPCHHFRIFPRSEMGKIYFDSIFQIELQKAGQYHIHYKNFRLELGRDRLEKMSDTMKKSLEK